MKVKYETLSNCITATLKCDDKMTFCGAGKTKEEAENVMWIQYNRYYSTIK